MVREIDTTDNYENVSYYDEPKHPQGKIVMLRVYEPRKRGADHELVCYGIEDFAQIRG
jgi:hypothetical protein